MASLSASNLGYYSCPKLESILTTWFKPYSWENGLKLVSLMKKTHSCKVKKYSRLVVCECIDCHCELQVATTGAKATVTVWSVFRYDTTVAEASIET